MAQHEAGDSSGAVDGFMRAVCGDDYRTVVERTLPPGALAQAAADADGLFRHEIPALLAWRFSADAARRVTCPTLVVAGSESPPVVRASTDTAAAAIPNARIHVLDGEGHFAHRNDPALVAGIIREFVGT